MSVGILSAVGRVWGKALQTDAPVSPNNYGGPLVDIRGRVMGVIVPLSPQSAEEIAGVEWYDSGIGFAVPLEAIQTVLPKLKRARTCIRAWPASSCSRRTFSRATRRSPPAGPTRPPPRPGSRRGDRIVEIGGRKVARSAEVKQEISRHYAGDKVHFVVLRGKKRIEADLVLASKLEPFQHGFLGILPLRDGDDAGVTVRYVYPGSPAAEAKIEPGDVIVSVGRRSGGGSRRPAEPDLRLEPGMSRGTGSPPQG